MPREVRENGGGWVDRSISVLCIRSPRRGRRRAAADDSDSDIDFFGASKVPRASASHDAASAAHDAGADIGPVEDPFAEGAEVLDGAGDIIEALMDDVDADLSGELRATLAEIDRCVAPSLPMTSWGIN